MNPRTTEDVLREQEQQSAANMKGITMANTMLDEEFDVDNEPGSKFELLPAGMYSAEILTANVGMTKNGEGTAVKITWQITAPAEYERRQVFQTVLINHTSAKAQEIGRGMFRDIASACGITGKITDLEALYFQPCAIKVRVEPGKDGYDDKNRISRVLPIGAMATAEQVRQAEAAKSAKLAAASEIKPAFEASKDEMNDEIPFNP